MAVGPTQPVSQLEIALPDIGHVIGTTSTWSVRVELRLIEFDEVVALRPREVLDDPEELAACGREVDRSELCRPGDDRSEWFGRPRAGKRGITPHPDSAAYRQNGVDVVRHVDAFPVESRLEFATDAPRAKATASAVGIERPVARASSNSTEPIRSGSTASIRS